MVKQAYVEGSNFLLKRKRYWRRLFKDSFEIHKVWIWDSQTVTWSNGEKSGGERRGLSLGTFLKSWDISGPAKRVHNHGGRKISGPAKQVHNHRTNILGPSTLVCVITKTKNLRPAKSGNKKFWGPVRVLIMGYTSLTHTTRVPWNYWHKNFGTPNSKFWTKNVRSWNRTLVVWLWFGTSITQGRKTYRNSEVL